MQEKDEPKPKKGFFRNYKASEVNTIIGQHFLSLEEGRFENFSEGTQWKTQPNPSPETAYPQFAIVKSKDYKKRTAIFTTMTITREGDDFVTNLGLGKGLNNLPPPQTTQMDECDQILIPLDIRSRKHIVLLRIVPPKGDQPAICTLLDPSAIGLFHALPEGLENSIKNIFGQDTILNKNIIFNKTILFQQWEDVNCGINVCCNAIDLMDDPDCTISQMPTWRIDERLQFEDRLADAMANDKIERQNTYGDETPTTKPTYTKAIPNYLTSFYHRNHVIIKTALLLALVVIPLAFIPGAGPFLAAAAGYVGLGSLAAIQLTAITAGLIVGVGMLSSVFNEALTAISDGISKFMNNAPPENSVRIASQNMTNEVQENPDINSETTVNFTDHPDIGNDWTDVLSKNDVTTLDKKEDFSNLNPMTPGENTGSNIFALPPKDQSNKIAVEHKTTNTNNDTVQTPSLIK